MVSEPSASPITFAPTRDTSPWTIVPGSGTGGFTGIAGEGSFDATGGRTVTYALEYRFD